MRNTHTVSFLFASLALAVAPALHGVSELIPCLANTGDWQPIGAHAPVPAAGRMMVAVFSVDPKEKITMFLSKWVVVDVGDVAPPGYEIGQARLRREGKSRGRFVYSQDGPLPVGKYRLEVSADGKPWKSAEITVVDVSAPQIGPTELFPLVEGKTWAYAFVQEAGSGARLKAGEAKLDPDGKLRATVTMVVGQPGEKGTHITIARGEKVVTEEWWQLDARGLVTTQRIVEGELWTFDPPQVLLRVPSAAFEEWPYEPSDKSYQQTYRLWCLGKNTLPGLPAGFLVVVEQNQAPNLKITVERYFVPGMGIVRSVTTVALAGNLLSRETMILRDDGT